MPRVIGSVVAAALLLAITGCGIFSDRPYIGTDAGIGLPMREVDKYARAHNISRKEAANRLAKEIKSHEHAVAEQQTQVAADGAAGGQPVRPSLSAEPARTERAGSVYTASQTNSAGSAAALEMPAKSAAWPSDGSQPAR